NGAGCSVYNKRIAVPVIQRGEPADGWGQPCLPVEVANVGALNAFRNGESLTADWPLYTLNSEAAEQWADLGISQMVLSPEDTGDNLKALLAVLGDRAVVPVYQHTPLMISATKPQADGPLIDRKKQATKIEKSGDQFVLIFEAPFSLVDHLEELRAAGARHFRIDLTYGVDNAEDAAGIIRNTMKGLPMPGSYDGNYRKTL
ncbi:hypothetical protein, partial [Pontiella sp.]|uniref:hypothetical protein n=1 Tax=Pontiella sp. TaxID=2837462 RepID=UPI00356693FE